ncbi:hypothetical protein F5Y19DRAFT_479758 [Xylariaceae sp. FL1651]|nr:hypothetical protein F5Y19DRAFT_479758 [Xylariaceae sp. FL1651]
MVEAIGYISSTRENQGLEADRGTKQSPTCELIVAPVIKANEEPRPNPPNLLAASQPTSYHTSPSASSAFLGLSFTGQPNGYYPSLPTQSESSPKSSNQPKEKATTKGLSRWKRYL